MNTIYVFKYVPASIKRLIYLYSIGLGTPTSKLIKEEYDKLFEASNNSIIVYKHMSMYEAKDIGFMGCKICVKKIFQRTIAVGLQKQYKGDIGSKLKEDLVLPQQLYEIDGAKMYYLYNCSNANKFNLIVYLLADVQALEKLFKYKILQLNNEELNSF